MDLWTRKKKGKVSKWFLKNGSMFLQELVDDCNGISNPIRMFSSCQISNATIHFNPKCFFPSSSEFSWYTSVIEGRSFAIKRFTDAWDGDKPYNEVVLSARVSNHSGFLKLMGCCLEFPCPVVVFENPEYGVLNERGTVGCEDAPLLPWNVRLKIAKEVATAITYLHTAFPRIIVHRNINPMSVFLDKNWTAKLTNFSLAITLPEGKSSIEDKRLVGTFGYFPPDIVYSVLVTEYTDVYSFGIFMLVLLMGRPALFPGSSGLNCTIYDYVTDLLDRGEPAVEFVGHSNDMRPAQMKMFLELALRCCTNWRDIRPKMILVAKEIKRIERLLDC